MAARRIRKHYSRDADVIYPPVDTQRFRPSGAKPEDFYLVVSRLVYAKRIDIAVEAFANTDRRLVVIGQGERLPHLKKIATPNIEFLGYQSDEVIRDHYSRCRGLVFPGEEDFGLTLVEAQACGRPVVAYAAGGSLETVIDGKTGVFFHEQDATALREALERFEEIEFDSARIRANAERFDSDVFSNRISAFVEAKHNEYENTFFR